MLAPRIRTLSAVVALALPLAAVALASMAAPRGVTAQSVTGVVRDSLTSAVLPGVLVSVLDAGGDRVRGALTDERGRFQIAVPMGRYRLSAVRIGLRPTTTDPFDLDALRPRRQDLLMSDRAVQIEGLVVDARVQSCRLDPGGAIRIQRWWQEIRTALGVSAVLQRQEFAQFRVEKFEHEWRPDLRRIIASNRRTEASTSSRPFISESAELLSEDGFVQGDLTGQRQYFAPDAEVLLSDVFLSLHCFALAEEGGRDDQLGLRFEPTRDRDVTDITGTLWVDTTTAELQELEFRYVGLEGVEAGQGGGMVAFDYLPSGAWIVSEWYIRMPKLGIREGDDPSAYELIGYVDVGAEVALLSGDRVVDVNGLQGAIRGVVYDSIRGTGLPDARVTILGTRFDATTDSLGEFVLTNVPIGRHNVTFFHSDPNAWGLGSSFVDVDVKENLTSDVSLAVPSFRQAALALCMGGGGVEAQTVVVGHLLGPGRRPMARTPIELRWMFDEGLAEASTRRLPATSGSDGRFVVCTVPGEVEVALRVRVDDEWVVAAVFTPPTGQVTYREVWFTR
jgi:hypothetical protein